MIIPAPFQSKTIKIGAILCLTVVFLITTTYHVYPEHRNYYHRVIHKVLGQKSSFVELAMNTYIDDPWDYEAVAHLCENTVWREGLTFMCSPFGGGIGNIRNVAIHCFRYAIEGGGNLILPRFVTRNPDLVTWTADKDRLSEFEYLFDVDYMMDAIKLACPQITVHKSDTDVEDLGYRPSTDEFQHINAGDFGGGYTFPTSSIPDPGNWRQNFETWLNATIPYTSASNWSAWIDLGIPFLQYPQAYQYNVSKSIGRIFRFPEKTRRLAATVYYELSRMFDLGINPSSHGIADGVFLGAHLRTSIDAAQAHFQSYETQSSNYLAKATEANLSIIYVGSGNPVDVARFATEAWLSHKIKVISKDDLLKGDDLAALKRLTWDQQGLVDYDVLLRASKFVGIFDSSFAINIAERRHVLSKVMDRFSDTHSFEDEFSTIYGWPHFNDNYFLAMWP